MMANIMVGCRQVSSLLLNFKRFLSSASFSTNVQECLQELSSISVTPGTDAYSRYAKLYNPAFAFEHPAFVALPTTIEECQKCLAVANFNKVPVAVRSGGHCFAGYSTIGAKGFVVSLVKMRETNWIDDATSVKIQAGASWNDVYNTMPDDKLVVGGCCPSVGIGGYVLGGGYGLLARRFGLASDNALSMTMITANGERVVKASPSDNSDLFWAMCGGGGGNFGVLVDVTFKTHPAPPCFYWSSFNFHSQEESELALKAIGKSVKQIPDGLNVDMLIHKLPGYNQLQIDCVFSNLELANFPLVKELKNIVGGHHLHKPHVYPLYRDLSTTYAQRHGYVHFEGEPVYMKGSFIDDFPPALADELINLQIPNDPFGIIEFVHVGGQIASKNPSFSSYPNRLAQYNCYTYGRFQNKSEWETVFGFANHVNSLLMSGGYANGAYVNYMDRFLHNWAEKYYGGNYARLCDIKSKWNAVENGGSLHFLQEIGSSYDVPQNTEPKPATI